MSVILSFLWGLIIKAASPYLVYIGGAGFGLLILSAAYLAGINHEKSVGQEAALKLQIATLKEDLVIAQKSQDFAEQQAKELQEKDDANEEALTKLQQALAARPVSQQCLANQSDVDLLLGIK